MFYIKVCIPHPGDVFGNDLRRDSDFFFRSLRRLGRNRRSRSGYSFRRSGRGRRGRLRAGLHKLRIISFQSQQDTGFAHKEMQLFQNVDSLVYSQGAVMRRHIAHLPDNVDRVEDRFILYVIHKRLFRDHFKNSHAVGGRANAGGVDQLDDKLHGFPGGNGAAGWKKRRKRLRFMAVFIQNLQIPVGL